MNSHFRYFYLMEHYSLRSHRICLSKECEITYCVHLLDLTRSIARSYWILFSCKFTKSELSTLNPIFGLSCNLGSHKRKYSTSIRQAISRLELTQIFSLTRNHLQDWSRGWWHPSSDKRRLFCGSFCQASPQEQTFELIIMDEFHESHQYELRTNDQFVEWLD